MKRRFVDVDVYESRNLAREGNVDFKYWFKRTHDEKIRAAGVMTSVAFRDPDFFTKKLDRTIFTARKHSST